MISHLSQTLDHIGSAINTIVSGSVIGKLMVGFCSATIAYFAPIWYLLLICFATTVVDMVYGIKVAKKLGKKIESGKNWNGTLRKIRDEGIILSLLHGLEWAVIDQSGVFILTGGATIIITLTEMWSILENLNTLDENGPWRLLGKFLRKKGEEYVGLNLKEETYADDNKVANKPSKRLR